MNRNHAPRTLDTKLHTERTRRKSAEIAWDDPEWNEAPDGEYEEQHRETTAQTLRDEPGDGSACYGATVPDDGGFCGEVGG